MKMFRKCLEKFGIVSEPEEVYREKFEEKLKTLKEASLEKDLEMFRKIQEQSSKEFLKSVTESSGAKKLREQLEFYNSFDKIPMIDPNSKEGTKFDQGKLSYTLLPFKAITEVVKVLEFGRLKYAKDNWQKVPNAKERYIDAALRHIVAYIGGEIYDPESGLHHLAHATCCLLFVIWFDGSDKEKV